jgi:hypothetical protein
MRIGEMIATFLLGYLALCHIIKQFKIIIESIIEHRRAKR